MGKIEIPSKIRLEDFDEKEQSIAEKIASSVNPFMETVYRLLNGSLNSDNMTRQISSLVIKIDASGAIIGEPQIRSNINARVVGLTIISIVNNRNSNVYPTSAPFISFTSSGNIITIKNIIGLPVSSEWSVGIEIIAN